MNQSINQYPINQSINIQSIYQAAEPAGDPSLPSYN